MALSREEKALNGVVVSLGGSGAVAIKSGGVVLAEKVAEAVTPEAAAFIATGLSNAWEFAPVTTKFALASGQAVAGGVTTAAEGTLLAAAAPYILCGVIVGGLVYAGYQIYMYNKEQGQVRFA